MDIVLGVSLTPKTVRMALVEGANGDGEIVDHDTFEVPESDGSATSNAVDQVVAAIVGTQESAAEGGHELTSIGVTWSDRSEAAELRDALAARNIRDVILVSELHAAGALAQAAGRAVGYDSTALLFVDRDSATLSVVRSDDGSIVKVLSNNLHGSDAMAMLVEMVAAVEAQDSPPQGIFVVGSGVDITSVKEHLEDLVSLPVRAPEESGLALARGAALAAANAPTYDATTAGLAYSLDPEGATAGNQYGLMASVATMRRAVDVNAAANALDYDPDLDLGPAPVEEGRKPFLLVGSALTSIFVVGVVALVISLAVAIRPTADQRPDPGQAIVPNAAPPAAPVIPEAPPPAPEAQLPAPPPPPVPETIKAPVPVAAERQAPPRKVYVEDPPQAPAPVVPPPEAAPAPVDVPPAPPVAVPPVVPPPAVIPPIIRAPWQQRYNQYPPQQQYPQYPPQQQYPQYPPQQQYPQYPQQQYPQYPQQGGQGGYDGPDSGDGPRGGYGNGGGDRGGYGGGPHVCILLLCTGGGH
ncbi:MAG: hypothetical protein JWQ86_6050 [Mycobacterium sp.]|jgi:hypothetical protein|nr:hypothetical protein [Mycobacterium sp.]